MNWFNTQQKIALARGARTFVKGWRRLRGLPMQGQFVRRRLRWQLDLDEGIDFSIYLLGSFEPDAVRCYERYVRPGDTVLDIGANVGGHTLPLARAVGSMGRVLAFEPTVYASQKLRANLALNPELGPRVTLHQMLLTDTSTAQLPESICSSWPLEATEGLHPEHGGKPQSTSGAVSSTLDEVVAAAGVDRIAFVKLDVDGFELSVLRGATTALRGRPPILIELCPHVCVEHGYAFGELIDCLRRLGYRFEDLNGHTLPDDADALNRLIPEKGGINALALPR